MDAGAAKSLEKALLAELTPANRQKALLDWGGAHEVTYRGGITKQVAIQSLKGLARHQVVEVIAKRNRQWE